MDKDANPAEPIEPQNKYAREVAALEDRQQAKTEKKTPIFEFRDLESVAKAQKKITGEEVKVEGPSPTYGGDHEFCPLCNRFVSPTERNYGPAGVLIGTAILGLFITQMQLWSLGSYSSYTGTTTLTFSEAVLDGLLVFAQSMFVILILASILWMAIIRSQEKRCPICNAKFSLFGKSIKPS